MDSESDLISFTASRSLEKICDAFPIIGTKRSEVLQLSSQIYSSLARLTIDSKPHSSISIHAVSFFTNSLKSKRKTYHSGSIDESLKLYYDTALSLSKDIFEIISLNIITMIAKFATLQESIAKTSFLKLMIQILKFNVFAIPDNNNFEAINVVLLEFILNVCLRINYLSRRSLIPFSLNKSLLNSLLMHY